MPKSKLDCGVWQQFSCWEGPESIPEGIYYKHNKNLKGEFDIEICVNHFLKY